ncbi:MAG: hypothetical protein UT34_C0002G0024 [candidate division WS6 bacterium GW2011_GWF2_39_15]|uniref:Uncharacterized protein n=1 Tax=candidate division WS6 bacterium GW2011_GWF2_39_15 TaxID=1619100 RepID=A0A0G0QV40_9BACT|nr:MAG: hypothetical protein UT34_C0002G0024 [candidate division WS6 bacterium GW2011_GWF2_39_15]
MSNQEINKELQRKIFLILSDRSIWGDNLERIQNDFIDKYYEVLKICLDLSITKDVLDEIKKDESNTNYTELMKITSRLIENEKSYLMLNRFLTEYLKSVSNITNRTSDNLLYHQYSLC